MFVLEYIAQNMSPLVPWMALFWFIVGILVGQRMQTGSPSGPAAKSGGKSRASSGNGKPVELYIGNLPFSTSEKELQQTFRKFGPVRSVRIITNAFNGKSKGYGFILMGDNDSADAAMKEISGSKMRGREVVVNLAKSKKDW